MVQVTIIETVKARQLIDAPGRDSNPEPTDYEAG
jgi:hypothetical protein